MFEHGRSRWSLCSWVGAGECQASVGSVRVVVLDVGVEHYGEVAAAADEHPVEAFSADRADEAFGVGVGLRCADRGADHRGGRPERQANTGVEQHRAALRRRIPEP